MISEFKTAWNREPAKPAPVGSRFAKTYLMTIDGHGHKVLKEDGLTDRYELIQSHLEETKIENIINKALATGDMSGLMVGKPVYADFTNAPSTLAEAQNMLIAVEQEFEKLPLEIRAKFDHSATKYIAEYGTENWMNNMGLNSNETLGNNSIQDEVIEKVEAAKIADATKGAGK